MKYKLKDFFSLSRYKSVIISILQKLLSKMDNTEDYRQVHIIEQYMYRLLACEPCVNKGSCVNCGCMMPERAWVRTDYCSALKWPPFMEKDEWENYKEERGINFILQENI